MKKRLIYTVLIIVGVGLIVKLSGDILRLLKAGEKMRVAERRISELEEKKKELSQKYQYFQSPEFIEEEARNKLNMARLGETIVILPQDISRLINRSQNKTSPQSSNWEKWRNLFF